jgi:predicted small metal-binding protein
MFTYACCDYPEMKACSGRFEAESEAELWAHIEMHATVAHKEDP